MQNGERSARAPGSWFQKTFQMRYFGGNAGRTRRFPYQGAVASPIPIQAGSFLDLIWSGIGYQEPFDHRLSPSFSVQIVATDAGQVYVVFALPREKRCRFVKNHDKGALAECFPI